MKTLLILVAIFIQSTSMVVTASTATEKIESIDLNLKNHEVAVTFLGLSDGEATLIQGPKGENVLVNIGVAETEVELERWLSFYGVKEITTLIITHQQAFSDQQLSRLVSKYNIRELVATPQLSAIFSGNLAPSKQLIVKSWGEGASNEVLPDVKAQVQFAGHDKNEGLDFTLQFFKHRLFLMTSSSQRAKKMLMKKNLEDVNILKLPNYSSEDYLAEKLIHFVNPQIAILFAVENDLPDPDIIDDLQDTWSKVYFTKKHGTVTIKFTEGNYEVFNIPVEALE